MDNKSTLSIKFKDKEILNTGDITLTKIRLLIINEFAFNIIIYIWYGLYKLQLFPIANPFFALVLSLIQNIILFIYLLINGLSYADMLKYTIVLLIFKIFPIYSMRNDMNISFFDVYVFIYLYLMYIFLLLVIFNVFLKKNVNILNIFKKDITNDKYDKNITSNAYDTIYNDMILRII
jgi:hypothetical protein